MSREGAAEPGQLAQIPAEELAQLRQAASLVANMNRQMEELKQSLNRVVGPIVTGHPGHAERKQSRARPKEPPQFDPSTIKDTQGWIEMFESYADSTYTTSNIDRINLFYTFMHPNVSRSVKRTVTGATWAEARAKFLSNWGTVKTLSTVERELNTLKQLPSETVQDYSNRCRPVYEDYRQFYQDKYHLEIPPTQLIMKFFVGLNDSIKNRNPRIIQAVSLDDAITLAKTAEEENQVAGLHFPDTNSKTNRKVTFVAATPSSLSDKSDSEHEERTKDGRRKISLTGIKRKRDDNSSESSSDEESRNSKTTRGGRVLIMNGRKYQEVDKNNNNRDYNRNNRDEKNNKGRYNLPYFPGPIRKCLACGALHRGPCLLITVCRNCQIPGHTDEYCDKEKRKELTLNEQTLKKYNVDPNKKVVDRSKWRMRQIRKYYEIKDNGNTKNDRNDNSY